jgi:acyl-CoA thioesterase-1
MKYALVLSALGVGGCGGDKPPAADSGSAQASALPSGVTRDSSRALTRDTGRVVSPETRRVILFAGTSLTAGRGLDPDSAYPQQLQRKIDSAGLKWEVVNAGESGETSASLLRRLDWLMRAPFDILVIETGANDGLRGIPVTTMRDNIQQILERVRAARPEARIVLVQMEALPNLGRAYTQGFREVFPELARKHNVTLLPFLLENVAGVRELNQGDGIHPNEDGERIVTENVWKGLRPLLR